jgi:hypothetical protein
VVKWGSLLGWRRVLLALAFALLSLGFASSAAARTTRTGYDISYPQCGGSYPRGQAFGIAGVNGGLANDANKCLRSELAWANSSPGLTRPLQAPASLYINTADPGPTAGVTDWPTSGTAGPYGTCRGDWSRACAYVYGQQRATYSYNLVSAIDPDLASTAPWWLDVETSNSWATSSTSRYRGLNIAAIKGFISGLTNAGASSPVGIYSSTAWWKTITGLTSRTTAAKLGSAPPAWVEGARTVKQARGMCAATAFTGARPSLAQYSRGGFDADLRCGRT